MNNVETIRNVLKTHGIGPKDGWKPRKCSGCVWIGWDHEQHVAEVIDLAIVTGKWIHTVEQLSALDIGDDDDTPIIRSIGPDADEFWKVYEANGNGTWALLTSAPGESEAWLNRDVAPENVPLPALLLWRP